jgi:hypothetical protein
MLIGSKNEDQSKPKLLSNDNTKQHCILIALVKNGQEMWDQSKRMAKKPNGDGEKKARPLFSSGQGKKRAYRKSMWNIEGLEYYLGCVFVINGMDFLVVVSLCHTGHVVVTLSSLSIPSNYKIRTKFCVA